MLVGKKIGPFAIDRELGSGAMGSVYRAKHLDSGKWVAIKIVSPALASNETIMHRFEREWEILRQLKHPNIIRLFATGRFSGTPFYAMEYVEGESLDRVMERRGRISWEEVVRLGRQLCAALQHAHDKGIVHRDMKPSNVMLLKDGSTVKLTDFGIAKDLDRTALTEANCTVGTASYMSPEQCKGERNITNRSDLYSMGVMFYELLTGQKPFKAESAMEMFMQHVKGKFERPSRLALDVPVFLDTLVCQLMEKDPERRPYDAAMVAEAMGRIEEKVAAQQAAGIDAAKTRNRDKPAEAAMLDAEDKDAARALLGKKKKKKQPQVRAFYQKTWFHAVTLLSLLVVVIGTLAFLLLSTPSAESLYRQAESVMAADSPEAQLEARMRGPIFEFLQYYGDRDDAMGQKMQRWVDKIDRDEFQRQIMRRKDAAIKIGPPEPEEKACLDALDEELDGNLKAARAKWTLLVEKKKERAGPIPSDARSAWLYAWARLELLNSVNELDEKLKKGIKMPDEKDKSIAAELLREAVKAFELERRDESVAAQKAWEELKKKASDEPTRDWWLLANMHLRDLASAGKKSTHLSPENDRRRLPLAAPAIQNGVIADLWFLPADSQQIKGRFRQGLLRAGRSPLPC
jgi:eukaryotic-like serine/threonine-protein kinase